MVVHVASRLLFLVASCFFVGLLSLICLETDLGTHLCGIYTSSDLESYCFIRESWLGRAQVEDLGVRVLILRSLKRPIQCERAGCFFSVQRVSFWYPRRAPNKHLARGR